jgi:hypothetical protein
MAQHTIPVRKEYVDGSKDGDGWYKLAVNGNTIKVAASFGWRCEFNMSKRSLYIKNIYGTDDRDKLYTYKWGGGSSKGWVSETMAELDDKICNELKSHAAHSPKEIFYLICDLYKIREIYQNIQYKYSELYYWHDLCDHILQNIKTGSSEPAFCKEDCPETLLCALFAKYMYDENEKFLRREEQILPST